MFKRSQFTSDPRGYRVHDRRPVSGMEMVAAERSYHVLDYSSGGVRVLADEAPPRVAVIEIFSDGRLLERCAAVLAWHRDGEAGYAFRKDQSVYFSGEARESAPAKPTLKGSAIRERLKL